MKWEKRTIDWIQTEYTNEYAHDHSYRKWPQCNRMLWMSSLCIHALITLFVIAIYTKKCFFFSLFFVVIIFTIFELVALDEGNGLTLLLHATVMEPFGCFFFRWNMQIIFYTFRLFSGYFPAETSRKYYLSHAFFYIFTGNSNKPTLNTSHRCVNNNSNLLSFRKSIIEINRPN